MHSRSGVLPVSREERVGEHTGLPEYAREKRREEEADAQASRFGVRGGFGCQGPLAPG
jgi:hypothetical protein